MSACKARFGLVLLLLGLSLATLSASEVAALRRSARARMVLRDESLPPLHLKQLNVQARIEGRIARVAAESVFQNQSPRELEATYLFPLPEGATVERFVLWMNGEPVEGKVEERQRARAVYETIVHQKRDPGLLEESSDGTFQFRIFPVPANGEQKVRIEYAQVLPLDAQSGALRFSYPLAVDAPRTPESRVARDFILSVALEMDGPIAKLSSSTHDIATRIDTQDARRAQASLEESRQALDKDFELSIALQGAGIQVLCPGLAQK